MEKSYTKLQIVFKDVLNVSNFQRSFKYSGLFVMISKLSALSKP